jgi:hypothetical protein
VPFRLTELLDQRIFHRKPPTLCAPARVSVICTMMVFDFVLASDSSERPSRRFVENVSERSESTLGEQFCPLGIRLASCCICTFSTPTPQNVAALSHLSDPSYRFQDMQRCGVFRMSAYILFTSQPARFSKAALFNALLA